jgi:uncharacterized protein YciI
MSYALLCTIDPSKLDLFARLRADHYAFLIENRDKILFGGPARVAEGSRPETMIIILRTDSRDEAEAFLASEPYNRAGGFSHVGMGPWSQVIPAAPGALERTLSEERAGRDSGATPRDR